MRKTDFSLRAIQQLLLVLSSMILTSPILGQGWERFYFKHYDTNSGLSQNTANCLLQDKTGFIWIGTKDGLNRFDGSAFKRISDGNSEYCSLVSTLMEDADGMIWVGTHQGIGIYNPSNERLDAFDIKTENGSPITMQVQDLCADNQNNVYIAVENIGIYRFDKNTKKLSLAIDQHKVNTGTINKVLWTPDGRLWIGTFGGGIYYSDDSLGTIHKFIDPNGIDYFKDTIINSLKVKGDKIYVATENLGLHAIDIAKGSVSPVFVKDENGDIPFIRDFIFYGSSQIWLGSESGLYIYDLASHTQVAHLEHNCYDRFSISDNAIYSLLADRHGGVWIGSYFGGVDYLNMSKMRFDKFYRNNTSNNLGSQRIRELCVDAKGQIYVGSEDNGLYVFNPSTGSFDRIEGIIGNNIHGLCIDGDELWIGTFSSGLSVKNLATGNIRHYTTKSQSGLNSDYVFTVCRTVSGDLYIGTFSGMQRYNREADTFETLPDFSNIFVYNIFEDSSGNLWAATYDKGLYMRRGGSFKWINFMNDPENGSSLPSNKVYGVSEDGQHNIWIATQNGPCVYSQEYDSFDSSFLGIDRIQGVVYRVVNDNYGRYWFTTNQGLYCLDSINGKWRHFTVADGLPTNQFNYSSSLSTSDGRIYLGTIDGLVSFEPLKFSLQHIESKPVLTDLMVNGQNVVPGEKNSPINESITLASVVNLGGSGDSFSVKVVSLDFSLPTDRYVKYRLGGIDKEWHYLPLGEYISYSNLDCGNYRLEYTICDPGEETDSLIYSIDVVVKTPFYRTSWAIALFIIILILLIWLAFRHYQEYSRLNNQRYLEHYTREKERESYDSKINFFTNVAHEIRTPLSLIKAPLDCVFHSKVLEKDPEIKENLDVINMNVDRLLLLANQLLDFRKIESGKFQIHRQQSDIKELVEKIVRRFTPTVSSAGKTLKVDIPEGDIKANVDPEAITKIVSNLFTNAIKYGDKYVHVSLKKDDKSFKISLANDGEIVALSKREEIFSIFARLESHSKQSGTGIGLAYSRSLAQMHGGSLVMGDSDKENIFVLTVPFDSKEDNIDGENIADLEHLIKRNENNVTVLLVEDNPEMLSFLDKKLTSYNYYVKKATNGKEALAILSSDYIDIVVSDVMMPEMDGYELLGIIKGDINFSHIPVILLTAKTRMEDKLSGLDAGADAYIEKPFALEYLFASISAILRNRDRMRQRIESLPLANVSGKGLTKVDEDFLRRINELIHANYDNPDFSMEDVIEALGMSRTTFYRKIKGMLDLNPNDYIKMQRLKRAAQLFSEGHTSVSEVCYMVGFSSPGYFTKCFQKQFGMSPKDYIASGGKKSTVDPNLE